jgi:hypothetical protein
MKPTVYIETSIIGYVTSRPSRDLITAANQQMTHEWWNDHRERYDLFISQAVIEECSKGDPVAAQERLDLLNGIQELDLTDDVQKLAMRLFTSLSLPAKARIDSVHIAVTAANGIDYLLTWNCTHIANAMLRKRIIEVCEASGFASPTICTPQEMMGL